MLGAAVGIKGFSEVVLSKFFAVEIIVESMDFPLGLLTFGFTVLCCKRELSCRKPFIWGRRSAKVQTPSFSVP